MTILVKLAELWVIWMPTWCASSTTFSLLKADLRLALLLSSLQVILPVSPMVSTGKGSDHSESSTLTCSFLLPSRLLERKANMAGTAASSG